MFAANTIPTPALPLKGREQKRVALCLKGREQKRAALSLKGRGQERVVLSLKGRERKMGRKLDGCLTQRPSPSRGGLGGDGVQLPQNGATN